jgi:nucleoid-associated protein YgaU
MNRETKIGLLVGLAFVIVIGILISDHVSSTNEQTGAPLQLAGTALRSGLGEPASDDVAPMPRLPQNISPAQRILTREEAAGRNAAGDPGVVLVNPPVGRNHQQSSPQNGGDSIAERIRKDALAHGEDVVPYHGDNGTIPNDSNSQQNPAAPEKPAIASYKAQSGDTLGTIALKALGANNRANREAIVAANPSLKANRDLIVEGRSYAIPTRAGAKPASAEQSVSVATDTVPASDTGNWYVVQPHDSLWSIAMQEVGSPAAVATIEELNQDTLNGSDRVRPNMKLRLPPKKIAAAN